MAGRNQHHIPQAYQRGFGIACAGKPKEIWEFTKSVPPQRKLIEKAAAEHDFYSEPAADDKGTLDYKITAIEKEVLKKLATLCSLRVGATANAAMAAEVISHLAPPNIPFTWRFCYRYGRSISGRFGGFRRSG